MIEILGLLGFIFSCIALIIGGIALYRIRKTEAENDYYKHGF